MPRRQYLVPRSGRLLRDPLTMVRLPEEGAWKPCTNYWNRKLTGGDNSDAELGTPPDDDPAGPDDLAADKPKRKRSRGASSDPDGS